MAFGREVCACCGSEESIEEHHLYLKLEGCPDDLTVWLCAPCHGRAHGMRRRINHRGATKAGLAAAKARGTVLGNPGLKARDPAAIQKLVENRLLTTAPNRERAIQHVKMAIEDGKISSPEIIERLNDSAISTLSGNSAWSIASLRPILREILSDKSMQEKLKKGRIQKRRSKADIRLFSLAPIIAEAREAGQTSLRAIARYLEEREVPAPRGGGWQASSLAYVMSRFPDA